MAFEKMLKFFLVGSFPNGAIGGLLVNIILSFSALAFGFVFGMVLALGRLSGNPVLSRACTAVIEVCRALPLILIMFWFVLTVPLIAGKPLPALLTAFFALALYSSVNQAEIFRAGISSVQKGQWLAAKSTGLSGFQCMTCVILPQMFRAVLPSYVGFFISLFKDTSIVTMVGLIDLTYAGVMVSQRYPGQMFECYALMAVIFFIICFALSKASKRIEEKLARKYGILGC